MEKDKFKKTVKSPATRIYVKRQKHVISLKEIAKNSKNFDFRRKTRKTEH